LEEAGKVLIVRSGSEFYALDLRAVQEIVNQPEVTSLPQATGAITGLCRWRQKQVPVIDLGLYLGTAQVSLSGEMVMVVISDREQGILVEEIGPIVDLPSTPLISVDKYLDREQGKVLKAFEYGGDIAYILETQALAVDSSQGGLQIINPPTSPQ
jgi:chemotaxis signal transduction protein